MPPYNQQASQQQMAQRQIAPIGVVITHGGSGYTTAPFYRRGATPTVAQIYPFVSINPEENYDYDDWRATEDIFYDPVDGSYRGVRGQDQAIFAYRACGVLFAGVRACLRPRSEHAGVRVGEIDAWRCWLIDSAGLLRSTSLTQFGWPMHRPMDADNDPLEHNQHGIHAWRDRDRAEEYLTEIKSYLSQPHSLGSNPIVGVAFGRVKLWGTVVEHDLGYRASRARIASLERVEFGPAYYRNCPTFDAAELARRYGVA